MNLFGAACVQQPIWITLTKRDATQPSQNVTKRDATQPSQNVTHSSTNTRTYGAHVVCRRGPTSSSPSHDGNPHWCRTRGHRATTWKCTCVCKTNQLNTYPNQRLLALPRTRGRNCMPSGQRDHPEGFRQAW